MTSSHAQILVFWLLALALQTPAEKQPPEEARQAEIERLAKLPPAELVKELTALTPPRLRSLLGPPRSVARQVFDQCSLEQWIYQVPFSCRIEILSPLGRKPRIQTVRLTSVAR